MYGGAYIAIDEINEQGGIDGRLLELLVENDNNNSVTAVEVDKAHIEAGAVAIIGHLLSNTGQLAVPYINENETLMISPTISSIQYAGQDDHFITLMPVSKYQSIALSDTLKSHNKRNIGLIYHEANKAFSKAVVDDLEEAYVEEGYEVRLYENFDTNDSHTYDELVKKIAETDLDALVIIGPGFDVAKFSQSFSKLDFTIPIYAPVWSMTNELLVNGGPTTNGIYLVNYFDADDSSESFVNFKTNYEDKYGSAHPLGGLFSHMRPLIF